MYRYHYIGTLWNQFCQQGILLLLWRTRRESSMQAYANELSCLSMSLFTLTPCGDDKSTIKRHFHGWWDFGMTPKGLIWTPRPDPFTSKTLPSDSSSRNYSSTIAAFCLADNMFCLALRHPSDYSQSQSENPVQVLVGCSWRTLNLDSITASDFALPAEGGTYLHSTLPSVPTPLRFCVGRHWSRAIRVYHMPISLTKHVTIEPSPRLPGDSCAHQLHVRTQKGFTLLLS